MTYYFYIVEFQTGCKIGKTANFKKRSAEYRKPWCQPIKSEMLLQIEEHKAVALELYLREKLNATGNTKEFFEIPKETIVGMVDDYLKRTRKKHDRKVKEIEQ